MGLNKIKYGRKGRGNGSRVNKAAAIRDAWSESGASARPRDVIAALAAKALAERLGGIENARQALAGLARLLKN